MKVKTQRIHFIGIGGIGVSALARYYRSRGWHVSGSDAVRSETTDALKRLGIKVYIGTLNVKHSVFNRGHIRQVIYSAAVRHNHPELAVARKRKIPTYTYAKAVGELTKKYYTIAVSGSHGKSTATALLGLVLAQAGLDPTIIIGTKLRELGGTNFRAGSGNYLVLEADEWNKSFLHYYPRILVLTNVDKEHLDTYKTYAGVVAAFGQYAKNVPRDGYIIANWWDRGVRKAVTYARAKVIFYNKKKFPKHVLGIPGMHNQLNAEAAWQAAKLLGVRKSVAERIFRSYKGAWRRMERLKFSVSNFSAKGEARSPRFAGEAGQRRQFSNTVLYSDYAHHPTEIKATLQALREKHPERKIICVFQPHHQDRVTTLFKEFKRAFRDAHYTIMVPIYKVKGRDYKTGKTSEDLVRAIGKKNVLYTKDAKTAFATVRHLVSDIPGRAVVVFMSAGDLDAEVRNALL